MKIVEVYRKSTKIFDAALAVGFENDMDVFQKDLFEYFDRTRRLNLRNDVTLIECMTVMDIIKRHQCDDCSDCEHYKNCDNKDLIEEEWKEVTNFLKDYFQCSDDKSLERDVAKMSKVSKQYDDTEFIALAATRICALLNREVTRASRLN